MSGSHQFYTATGRALPLPPKRTPSRHSAVLRLPTRRADQERSTTVRTDSPGRIEAPHGGEFRNISASLRAASQLVVYDEAAAAAAVKAKKTARHATSSKASSVARISCRSSTLASAVVAAPTGQSSPPPSVPAASPSQRESAASSQKHVNSRNGQHVDPREKEESGCTTPRAKSTVLSAYADSASDTSSPCLNRMAPPERDEDDEDAPVKLCGDANDAASEVQSIPMSSTRQSRAPDDHDKLRLQPHLQAGNNTTSHDEDNRSMGGQSSASHHGSRQAPPGTHDTSHEREAVRQSWQLPPPPHRRNTAAAQAATPSEQRSSAPSSHHAQLPSNGYPESEASSQRHPAATSAAAAAASTTATHAHPNTDRHAALSAGVSHVSTAASSNYGAQHHRTPADRHDHHYSQELMEERRASRPAATASELHDVSYRPAMADQPMALVPAPTVVKYSTRSPCSDDDPLEMNTPIADRVRQRSVVTSSRVASVAFTVEGTELMPSLPRLQGRRANPTGEDDRTYRTIVRFIEYQPEAERPGLEEMLRTFSGREEELCALLTETYGADFEMVKSACCRGPSVPLLADDHRERPTSRTLLLAEAPHQQGRTSPPHSSAAAAEDEAEGEYTEDDYEEERPAGAGLVEADTYDDYAESSQPFSTPRVEEGDDDEEPVYDVDNYARELLTPAVPYERR